VENFQAKRLIGAHGKSDEGSNSKAHRGMYGEDDTYRLCSPMSDPDLYEQFQELMAYVNALRDDKEYALVAEEL
jgi:hypothetical protein